MPRLLVLIVVIALIVGALIFLSSRVTQTPTHTIEVDVPQGGHAG